MNSQTVGASTPILTRNTEEVGGVSPILSPQVEWPNIAIIGRMGAGKSAGAGWLAANYGYTIGHFAQALKDVAAAIWGGEAHHNREYLQRLGVAVREIDEDAWCNILMRQIDEVWGPSRVVVDDCRFPNEYQALAERGFRFVRVACAEEYRVDRLQRINKLDSVDQLEHESETALDEYDVDHTVINAGLVSDYHMALEDILRQEAGRV